MRRLRDLLFVAAEVAGDDERRGAATRGTLAVAAAGFCLSLAGAFTMPILFGVDERVHLAYVEVLLAGDLPEVDQAVPLDGRFRVLREFYPDGTEVAGPRGDVWVANHPPLSYLVAAGPAWVAASLGYDRGPPMVLRVLSGLGMALGVLATAAVCDSLLPGRRSEAMAAAGLAAFTPGLVSIGSYGYNDGVAYAVGTALLAVVLRVGRFGPTRGRLLAITGLGVAAILTRSALLPLLPIAGAVWLVRSWRSGRARALATTACIGVVPALLAGWFYARNIDLYGSVTGSGHLQEKFDRVPAGSTVDLLRAPRFLLGAWQDLWGSFRSNLGLGSGQTVVGSPDAEVGTRMWIGGGLVAAGTAGLVIAVVDRRPRRPGAVLTWLAATAWVVICVLGLASFASGGGSPHPRYLFPALSVVTSALVAGMARLPWAHLVIPGALLALVAVDLVLLARLSVLLEEQAFPERFSQPGSSTVVVVGVLTLGLAAGTQAVRAWRDVVGDRDPR